MTKLRVALDGRRLQDRPLGGVGRALHGVLDLVATEADVVVLTDGRREPIDTNVPQHALRPPGGPETIWLQWSVRRWLHGFHGVFHGTFNAVPVRSAVPTVASIYDLTFEVHSEGFGAAKRRVFQLQARHAARTARSVVTSSEFTKQDLVRHYGLPPDRVVVVPISVDARFAGPRRDDARSAAIRDRLGIREPYVAAIGGARRRGLEVAIGAWQRLRGDGSDVTLVVVGPDRVAPEPGLIAAGTLDDQSWAAVLEGAAAFCYPTRFEGFGVPALESIAAGTPVVCARVSALPEVLGDAAEWCDRPDVEAIAAGLRRVLEDPGRAAELRRRGLERAAHQPSWESAADRLLRVYHEASQP